LEVLPLSALLLVALLGHEFNGALDMVVQVENRKLSDEVPLMGTGLKPR